jgi:hypothetical protein
MALAALIAFLPFCFGDCNSPGVRWQFLGKGGTVETAELTIPPQATLGALELSGSFTARTSGTVCLEGSSKPTNPQAMPVRAAIGLEDGEVAGWYGRVENGSLIVEAKVTVREGLHYAWRFSTEGTFFGAKVKFRVRLRLVCDGQRVV